MTTMTISELTIKNPELAEKVTNLEHPTWTDWVSPDWRMITKSFNNNGPTGWIKVVQD